MFNVLHDALAVRNNGKKNETKKLEVVSKPQIRFKGPAFGPEMGFLSHF
jgi:hypothetical protein